MVYLDLPDLARVNEMGLLYALQKRATTVRYHFILFLIVLKLKESVSR